MRTNRAFTLLEMVLVIVLLSITMAMITPRLLVPRGRALELAAERVADVLTMFAQRESLSGRPVGIWHDAQRNWIVLVSLETDPQRPGEPADWRPDRTVGPAKLPPNVDADRGVIALADGRPLDFRQWPIAAEPGKPRPRLEITITDDEGREKTVILPPHAVAPYLASDERARLAAREPIDLDAAGRWREDW
jgi:prepilin-type N-terminal cleavage/methylation domain-containing protein